jgi:hypothetical protein
MLKAMKNLTSLIEITINGHIEETAYISEYNDMEDSEGSNLFEPGHVCEIRAAGLKSRASPPKPASGWFPCKTPPKR